MASSKDPSIEENDDSFWPSNQPSVRPLSGGGLVRQPRAPQPKQPVDDSFGAHLVNSDSISALKEHQQQTFSNLQQSKALLANFNRFSSANYEQTAAVLQKSALLMSGLTADLNLIFRKTRQLRQALKARLPDEPELQSSSPFVEDD